MLRFEQLEDRLAMDAGGFDWPELPEQCRQIERDPRLAAGEYIQQLHECVRAVDPHRVLGNYQFCVAVAELAQKEIHQPIGAVKVNVVFIDPEGALRKDGGLGCFWALRVEVPIKDLDGTHLGIGEVFFDDGRMGGTERIFLRPFMLYGKIVTIHGMTWWQGLEA